MLEPVTFEGVWGQDQIDHHICLPDGWGSWLHARIGMEQYA